MSLKYLLLILLVSGGASAQSTGGSPTSFGGACASQGSWTQAALSAAQNLRKVTLQLKDDANCKALGLSVQASIKNLEDNVGTASETPAKFSRISQLPQEINSLRSFAVSAPDMKQEVLKVMMDKFVEGARLSSQVTAGSPDAIAGGILDFGARLQTTTRTGLTMLNQVVDAIPQLDQCVTGDGQQALGAFFSGAVQMASSFASSGQDMTGSQLATTIAKLSNLTRERKYTKILRKLNQQEFMSSMSCLMEVTSESYCQARDGMRMFQKGMEDLKFHPDQKGKISAGNPFVGYYILNTHVPNITKWMQKVQIGIDPKLPTDAVYQNKIQQEETDFYKGVKTLLGDYNSALATIRSMNDPEAKRTGVVKLIIKISNSMITGGGSGYSDDGDKTNFFTMSKNSQRIPFDLIGMPVPDQVSGKVMNMPKLSAEDWFQANMNDPTKMPGLKDSISAMALAETIGINMQAIIRSANISAIEYYNKWYIVDKAALVNESNIDINYTVEDSLKAINQYLEQEKGRIVKYNGNMAIIPTITDTQIRIKTILDGYKQLYALGEKLKKSSNGGINQTVKEVQDVSDQYEKLINIVCEQFNVMQSRSGFLANRMENFVNEDYILLLKNQVDFTPYQQDLFTATGMAAITKMLQLYNGNPANVQTDLNMALRINKGNIDAMEMLLKDNVINTIAELDAVKRGGGSGSVLWSSLKRLAHDQITESSGSVMSHMPIGPFLPLLSTNTAIFWFKHSDRYPLTSSDSSPQSEFNDAANVEAQLCIQALAFYDQSPLASLCRGAALLSPLAKTPTDNMNVYYDEKLKSHMNDKVSDQMKKSWNHSDRICAFRDYNLRTMAKTMSMMPNGSTSQ